MLLPFLLLPLLVVGVGTELSDSATIGRIGIGSAGVEESSDPDNDGEEENLRNDCTSSSSTSVGSTSTEAND